MAYVPKRDPCVKCNNPVFFAERLVIEDQLYHRTCLKCARCSSVLTLGNFYQTEKDNEFCCETCPDEEQKIRSAKNSENRLSIAQRIALFEKETSNVLKKSLSDEEKSKSLSRQLPTTSPSSQGLSKFLSTQIDAQNHAESEDEKTANSLSSDSESDDDENPTEREEEKPGASSLISDSNVAKIISDVDTTKEITLHSEKAQQPHAVESQKLETSTIITTTDDINDFSNLPDDIELEFERLAEEAVNSPISTPIYIAQKPPPQIVKEEIKVDQIDVSEAAIIEPEKEEVKTDIHEEVLNQVNSTEENKNEYPEDLNPFGDDDVQVEEKASVKRPSLNPFGSGSEDEENDRKEINKSINTGTLPKPPRPPPPKTISKPSSSTNPFGSDDEEEQNISIRKTSSVGVRTPVPTPRRALASLTPEPSLRTNLTCSPGHSFKGSTSSLASSTEGSTMRRKKKKAPLPPNASSLAVDDDRHSKTPSTTPKKKRPAPTPPTSTPLHQQTVESTLYVTASNDLPNDSNNVSLTDENTVTSEQIESEVSQNSIVDEVSQGVEEVTQISIVDESTLNSSNESDQRRLIPLEESLIEEGSSPSISSVKQEEVTFRRKIIPLSEERDVNCENVETTKDNKEAENRHRQSQCSLKADSNDSLTYLNKSSHGKWKRRKGPAPALPGYAQPQRRVLQMLPLQEIRHELEVIEVQQQGLEKQGVVLEKMIRERCEGVGDNRTTEELLESLPNAKNPKEVEELILQLFEIVNEKNELFRRQAELMYLRRAHRLEEEQADVEFEIRTLMAQPECNKTDSDKAREEILIARLVEIVSQRNEVVDCLEMDRLREAEEDMSIKQRMESHTAKLDQEYLNQTPTKLSKKEKKKLKEAKKLKNKKLNDADKDLDTSELKTETTEKKKKKKKFLF